MKTQLCQGLLPGVPELPRPSKGAARNFEWPAGWEFGGFVEEYYMLQCVIPEDPVRITPRSYKTMLLKEEDLTRANMAFMVEQNLTRVIGDD